MTTKQSAPVKTPAKNTANSTTKTMSPGKGADHNATVPMLHQQD
ncbi:MAG: hypothetical protein JWP29_3480, partial [Rhodoferax sp.]|nr:hypothetical protein [Rhodoferax sp.]